MTLPQNLTEEVVKQVHKALNVPSLITLYIATGLLILFTWLILIDSQKSGYIKFMLIWFIGMVVSGVVLIIFIYSPVSILNFFAKIKSFF